MKIRELIIDAHGCKCDLNDADALLPTLIRAAQAINATVVKQIVHKYEPQGLTIVLLLAESHASLYTWPEFGYAAVEIFLCNEEMDPYKFWGVFKNALKPEKTEISEITRNVEK